MWVMHSRNAEANGACAMIRMPAMSECAAPKRRDASEIVGTCVIYANCDAKYCKTRLQHRSGCRNLNKRQYLSLVGFRTLCAAQRAAASFHFQFRGRIAPRNESHEGDIVTVWEKSTGGLPSSTAASNFSLLVPAHTTKPPLVPMHR